MRDHRAIGRPVRSEHIGRRLNIACFPASRSIVESKLVLLRHGRTRANGAGLDLPMSGWTAEPLDGEGERQLATLAGPIAHEVRPDLIVTSPLRRALQTAHAVAEHCQMRVRVDERLGEIHCGDADGVSLREVQARFAREWARNLAQSDPDFRWPNGESYREFRARVLESLHEVAVEARGGCALVVTHAGVISQVLGLLHGRSEAQWEAFRPRNCSLTSLLWSDHGPQLVAFDRLLSAR